MLNKIARKALPDKFIKCDKILSIAPWYTIETNASLKYSIFIFYDFCRRGKVIGMVVLRRSKNPLLFFSFVPLRMLVLLLINNDEI